MNKQVSGSNVIPEKVYFRIGEVSDLVGVDPHVLRYWESEFNIIKPRRAKSNQRLYRRKDVEHLLLIKTLLHNEGYTISGAKKLISKGLVNEPEQSEQKEKASVKKLAEIKKELLKIQQLLALKSLRY